MATTSRAEEGTLTAPQAEQLKPLLRRPAKNVALPAGHRLRRFAPLPVILIGFAIAGTVAAMILTVTSASDHHALHRTVTDLHDLSRTLKAGKDD